MRNIITTYLLMLLCTLTASATNYDVNDKGDILCGWNSTDAIGIYTTAGTRIKHFADKADTDTHYYAFDSYGWTLVGNTSYYAYSPYSSSYYDNGNTPDALPVSFINQKQEGNNNLSHISQYDYLAAQFRTGANSASIDFKHICSVFSFDITLSQTETVKTIFLRAHDGKFITSANMDLTNSTLMPTEYADSVSLSIDSNAASKSWKAYMVVAPADFTNNDLELTITTQSGKKYLATVAGTQVQSGKCYPIIVCETPCSHTFSSEEQNRKSTSLASSLTSVVAYIPDLPVDTENVFKSEGLVPDGISEIKATPSSSKAYTISGTRVADNMRGIQIINGKKYIKR